MKLCVIAILMLGFCGFSSGHSQKIQILVLDAHHGRPISDECLNIALGPWHGTDILAPTNKDGLVKLSIDHDNIRAELVPGRTCIGFPATKDLSGAASLETITLLPDYYVSCQYSKKLTKVPGRVPLFSGIPSFALHDVLVSGAVATNTCSKLKPTPIPGEIILVVRKPSFLEGMRS